MEAEKIEEICESVKNAEHYIVCTIDKNNECNTYLKSDGLEMRCMLKEIIEGLIHNDKVWLLKAVLLELNNKKERDKNGKKRNQRPKKTD